MPTIAGFEPASELLKTLAAPVRLAITHADHTDYSHDGHVHRVHDYHVDECVGGTHVTAEHDVDAHQHDATCGHDGVQHDDHIDFVHDGHRHAAHDHHYDEH